MQTPNCIAEGTYGRDESGADPQDDGEAHWAHILQNPLRTHKDPWSDYIPWVTAGGIIKKKQVTQ